MLPLVASILGLSALSQALNVLPRQTPAPTATTASTSTTTGAPQCCLVWVDAVGYLSWVGNVNVTVATKIVRIVTSNSVTSTETITVTNTAALNNLTSIISSELISTVPTTTSNPGVGNGGGYIAAPSTVKLIAPDNCVDPVTIISQVYTIPTTFGDSSLSTSSVVVTNAQFAYAGPVGSSQQIFLPAESLFPVTRGETSVNVPQAFIDWMRQLPAVVSQFPGIGSCTAVVASTSSFAFLSVNPVTISSTTQVSAQFIVTGAPFQNSTSSRATNVPVVPSSRQRSTTTIWAGASNTSIPIIIYTGAGVQLEPRMSKLLIIEALFAFVLLNIFA